MKYHMLITSREFEDQAAPLSREDFLQTLLVMKALNGVYFYNSGEHSGGSQPHRHLQCLPSQSRESLITEQLLLYALNPAHRGEQGEIVGFPKFGFCHGMVLLPPELELEELAEHTHRAYLRLYERFIPALRDGAKVSYNLIGTEHFLLLVPRRKEFCHGLASLNAMAFTGSIMTKRPEDYSRMVAYTPENILGDVTFEDTEQLELYRKKMIK